MGARTLTAALSAVLVISACRTGFGDDSAPAVTPEDTSGDRKASSGLLPSESSVVPVSWATADLSALDPRKADGGKMPFDPTACPLVNWQPGESPVAESQAEIFGETVNDSTTERTPTSVSLPSEQTLAELRTLEDVATPTAKVATHESYVADLMSLLPAQHAWVAIKPGVIDLAPEEALPVYLDDLHALAADPGHAIVPVAIGSYSPLPASYADETRPPAGVYRIPRPLPCDTIGEKPATDLFRPLSEISVTAASTSPPQRPNAVDYPNELKLPVDLACAYLEPNAPGYYFTPTRFGVYRPSRNTHPFCHNPLYFEDPNLERCGVSWGCLTNARSVGHFAGRLAILPYLTAAEPPCTCVRALADCPTCHEFDHEAIYPEPSLKGALAEAGVITGLFFIVP